MNPALAYEMLEVLEALEIDDRAGVLVLTGTGTAFSAGRTSRNISAPPMGCRPRALADLSRQRALAVAPACTISETDDRDGQRLVLRRRVHAAHLVRSRDCCRRCGVRTLRDQLGIIPAGVVTKAVALVMNQRDALYYIMTGETFDGKRAKEMGLVNDAVRVTNCASERASWPTRCSERTGRVARGEASLQASPRHVDGKCRRLSRIQNGPDVVSRSVQRPRRGMKQFLDDKSFKPGLGAYKKS